LCRKKIAFTISSTVSLSFAGTAALFAQVVIVSGLLVEARSGEGGDG